MDLSAQAYNSWAGTQYQWRISCRFSSGNAGTDTLISAEYSSDMSGMPTESHSFLAMPPGSFISASRRLMEQLCKAVNEAKKLSLYPVYIFIFTSVFNIYTLVTGFETYENSTFNCQKMVSENTVSNNKG